MQPVVYDATRPAETRVSGPGPMIHAFDGDCDVSLCGSVRRREQPRGGTHCPECERLIHASRTWGQR